MKQDRGAVREKIIDGARKLFAEKGYANTSIPDLVNAAGVTRGALYFYFKSKDDLFAEVFERVLRGMFAKTLAAAAEGPTLWGRIHNGREAFLDCCSEPEAYRIVLADGRSVLSPARRREIRSRMGPVQANFVQSMVAALRQAGEVPGTLPLEPISSLMTGAFEAAAVRIAESNDKPKARREISETLDLFVSALRAYAEKFVPRSSA
ncbi:MAG TPA: helix-turn-helix domain-containing protein [Candidatus Binataceae bacterium]|nr:helix-turn-helix domain-containing protein [Candidatus Binataceae bacterium]